MERLKNQDGSTLIVVIGFLTVLTIMGIAIITTSAAHYRMQKTQETRKEAFYAAESGIDGVIATLTEFSQRLREKAYQYATEELEEEIADQSLVYEDFVFDMRKLGVFNPSDFLDTDLAARGIYLLKRDGTVDQAAAEGFAADKYSDAFKLSFTSLLNNGGYTNDEVEPPVFIELPIDDIYTAMPNMSELPVFSTDAPYIGLIYNNVDFSPENQLVIPAFSYYHPSSVNQTNSPVTEKISRKLITVDLTITVPSYLAMKVDQNIFKFQPNILWTKALTAGGSLITNASSDAEIDGNVYAASGIEVGGSLQIDGEAVTGGIYGEADTGNVTFSENGSSLSVDGNVYAKNILVGTGVSGVDIDVNGSPDSYAFTSYSVNYAPGSSSGGIVDTVAQAGDVVVRRNLEMRGESTNINIGNNFTGFSLPVRSSGADTSPIGSHERLAETSCIIIDTPDIRLNPVQSSLSIANDTVISGIAYLDDNNSIYNTGESIALGDGTTGNYTAYKNLLTSAAQVGGQTPDEFEEFVDKFNENNKEDIEERFDSGELDDIYPVSEWVYGTYPVDEWEMYYNVRLGLFLPYKYIATDFKVLDNADYFYGVSNLVKRLNERLDEDPDFALDTELGIDPSAVIFDEGGMIDIGEDEESGIYKYYGYGTAIFNNKIEGRSLEESVDSRRVPASQMYFGQVNRFGDMLNGNPDFRQTLEANMSSFFSAEADGAQSIFTDFFRFNNNCNVEIDNGEYIIIHDGNVVITPDDNIDKAVIIATGNITLTGPLNIRGTIIAGGNITINGEVNIKNDYSFIAKAMAQQDAGGTKYLDGFSAGQKSHVWPTYSDKTRSVQALTNPLDTMISEDDFVYVHVEKDNTGVMDKYNTIKDVVTTANWRVHEY